MGFFFLHTVTLLETYLNKSAQKCSISMAVLNGSMVLDIPYFPSKANSKVRMQQFGRFEIDIGNSHAIEML